MSKEKIPVTPATRLLRGAGVTYSDHLYAYEEKGGTSPFGTRRPPMQVAIFDWIFVGSRRALKNPGPARGWRT